MLFARRFFAAGSIIWRAEHEFFPFNPIDPNPTACVVMSGPGIQPATQTQKSRHVIKGRLVYDLLRSVEAESTKDGQAGYTRGATAGGFSRRLYERASTAKIGVGRLRGTTIHQHELAFGSSHPGHGVATARVVVRAFPCG